MDSGMKIEWDMYPNMFSLYMYVCDRLLLPHLSLTLCWASSTKSLSQCLPRSRSRTVYLIMASDPIPGASSS